MSSSEVRYDPWAAEFQTELWDVYRTMRDEHPVYRAPGGEFFALTRFADVWAAAADHETFSSRVAEANDLLPQLIYLDPPRQVALRKLVSGVFTPRRVAAMEDSIRFDARSGTFSMRSPRTTVASFNMIMLQLFPVWSSPE
ncbi:hypothetical protein [[Mycobacterium] wendilense]|uniref:Cytochrome P450 n=1 Tax=[Mycobacterium] wendilense TaxID=3064284 RepID=A0ABN9P941_9MYCO|nr:hypothetical protein [Mycolicibacterium sp. MU0050]CAJ1587306.1 hypothetical protein MU0050_004726 [Mycolicibacterium sp. MU0050]